MSGVGEAEAIQAISANTIINYKYYTIMKKNWKLIVAGILLIGQIGQLMNGNCSPFVIIFILGLIVWHFYSKLPSEN